MKPYPFWSLKYLTVPRAMDVPPWPEKRTSKSPDPCLPCSRFRIRVKKIGSAAGRRRRAPPAGEPVAERARIHMGGLDFEHESDLVQRRLALPSRLERPCELEAGSVESRVQLERLDERGDGIVETPRPELVRAEQRTGVRVFRALERGRAQVREAIVGIARGECLPRPREQRLQRWIGAGDRAAQQRLGIFERGFAQAPKALLQSLVRPALAARERAQRAHRHAEVALARVEQRELDTRRPVARVDLERAYAVAPGAGAVVLASEPRAEREMEVRPVGECERRLERTLRGALVAAPLGGPSHGGERRRNARSSAVPVTRARSERPELVESLGEPSPVREDPSRLQ